MAYTYNDFVNAANQAGIMDQFDDDDLTTAQQHPEYGLSLLSLKRDYGNAQTEEQKLLVNEATNQLRTSYGLNPPGTAPTGTRQTAGSFGTAAQSTTPAAPAPTSTAGSTGTAEAPSSFSGTAPAATTPAAPTTETPAETEPAPAPLMNAGNNMYADALSNWQYNPAEDPSYAAYRKQYLTEADRATANTLGQAAAASAGRVNSYALNAANQAGDYYRHQLNNAIPQLEQNAWDRQVTAYNAGEKERADSYNNLITAISSTGYMPTAEELQRAGMTEEEAKQWQEQWGWQAYKNKQISAKKYKALFGHWPNGYNPNAGSGGGGISPNPAGDMPPWMAAYMGAIAGGASNSTAAAVANAQTSGQYTNEIANISGTNPYGK